MNIMDETPECAELFRAQQHSETPDSEVNATSAMMAAARATCWRRNQACDPVIARGAVACVLAGAVRKFALRSNGQRQIIEVNLTGDFLGFAPANPAFFLEAVSNDTRIASFTREQIDTLTARFPDVAALMRNCAADTIRRLEHHLLVQSRITASEKVGAYLATMTRRMRPSGTKAIVLPITRYDIADHLGIAVETVSRTMSALRRRGSIVLRTPRDIEIRDPSMLFDI
ncbi:MAG TPA: helix-turn-helix domain-containing protein [Allosphingosinicella sp.]|nr:helix-turn-helix domain-containing protein [Allosphingosinicella sp.]